jgi:hypothetical protein
MSFSITKKSEGANTVFEIAGNVDEDSNFTAPDLAAGAAVILDLEKITAINSVGIREWIKWVKAFPATAKLTVRKCPKIIVDQINMVAGFLPQGTMVQSFFVPYYADSSGNEKMVLFENGKEFGPGGLNPPAEVKDDSGEVMEMDVIEAKYFKFLNG